MTIKDFIILLAAVSAAGCNRTLSWSDRDVFALYRNSVADEGIRLHVASFDAADGENYNRENCEQAKELFQKQPGVKTKFWCEKGRFRK